MNISRGKSLPLSVEIDEILAPRFFTPFARSSHSFRWTGMRYSATSSSKTFSATCGSKIHIVRRRHRSRECPVPCCHSRRGSASAMPRAVVVAPHAMVELAREAADHCLVARIRESEAAAGESTEVLVRTDDDDRLAHALRLHGRHDAGGRAAVHDDVGLPRRGLNLRRRQQPERQENENDTHGTNSTFSARRASSNAASWSSNVATREMSGFTLMEDDASRSIAG